MDTKHSLPLHRRRHGGFSLVEMMVALTVGLFLVGGMLAVLASSSATQKARERASDVQTTGRYAIDFMKRDIQHAGYLGITSLFYPDESISSITTVDKACDEFIGRISRRIRGADDSNPYSGTCIPAANYLRGDILVVRRISPTPTPIVCPPCPLPCNTPPAGLVYYHSSYEGGTPFVGDPPKFCGTNRQPPYVIFPMEEIVYYLSPYTTTPGDNLPALYRVRLSTGPAMLPELVATGVEQMQVRYGQFNTDKTVRYRDALDMTEDDWDAVKSVQISLLVRGSNIEQNYTNDNKYQLANEPEYQPKDGYRRLVYTTVVQLRN